jgi:hypothetical protein
MREHRIRLRGGWEWESLDGPAEGPGRLTLPTRWPADDRRRRRLTRCFQHPPREPGSRVVLRLEHVPGIEALVLDGQPAMPTAPGRSDYEIPLEARASRHCLVLVVAPSLSGSPDAVTEALGWGHISLVIRPEGPTDSSGASP